MKDNKKAILAVCGAGAACLVILLACWFFGRTPEDNFAAEASGSNPTISWTAPDATPKPVSASPKPSPTPKKTESKPDSSLDDYPKVKEETSSEVVIDFAPPAEEIPQPQEPVVQATPTPAPTPTPEPAPVEYVEPETNPEPAPQPEGGGGGGQSYEEPTPDGYFYDPAFGWIQPGEGVPEYVDSDGDPDKQVGTM